ncbi:MAG: TonB-dependent receptor, partial [Capnocytophaga sp.]|nr:TonB-dependent receptor [Capnocytophaga sp.]
VQIISKTQIQRMGAVNLSDVLNQYINITVRPDVNTGKQNISLLGLGGNYFKILVDNIPLVNENGFGNNTDLSQINLEDVERIEIVEGAMGVTHGANAVTGVLNIITKKHSLHDWEINYTLQEESVGKEYNWKNKGKHIQNFKVAHNLNSHWYASAGVNRYVFSGFWNDYNGKYYQKTDGKRGYKFQPFETMQTNIVLNYRSSKINLLYKFEHMNELYRYYNRIAESTHSPIYGSYRFGEDRKDYYLRNFHHLNLNGKMKKYAYNISLSYQNQERQEEKYRYIINLNKEINNRKRKTNAMNVLYSTGSISRYFYNKKYQWQLGYELTHNQGFALLNDEGQTLKEVEKNVDNYDVYSVLEMNFTERFSLRPAGRFSYQNLFKNQYAYSLGTRYLFPKNIEWRASFGQSYRTPSFEELYSRRVFMGHSFLGNENLLPENGFSVETNVKKATLLVEKATMMNNLSASLNSITNKIHNVLLDLSQGTPHTQYINISSYRNYNIVTSHSLKLPSWDFSLGGSLAWISQKIDTEKYRTDNRFLLNINANANASYKIEKWDTSISAYYKFVGKSQMWLMSSTGYVIGDMDPYGWLDISLQKSFNRKIEFTFGTRNLLNTIDVGLIQKPLSGESTKINYPLGNGRSFFFKLTYNLNINY